MTLTLTSQCACTGQAARHPGRPPGQQLAKVRAPASRRGPRAASPASSRTLTPHPGDTHAVLPAAFADGADKPCSQQVVRPALSGQPHHRPTPDPPNRSSSGSRKSRKSHACLHLTDASSERVDQTLDKSKSSRHRGAFAHHEPSNHQPEPVGQGSAIVESKSLLAACRRRRRARTFHRWHLCKRGDRMGVRWGRGARLVAILGLLVGGCSNSPGGPIAVSATGATSAASARTAPPASGEVPTTTATSAIDPSSFTAANMVSMCSRLFGAPDVVARRLGQADSGYSWRGEVYQGRGTCSLAPPGELGPHNSYFVVIGIHRYDGQSRPRGPDTALATNQQWTLEMGYSRWFSEPLLSRLPLVQQLLDEKIALVKRG